MSNLKRFLDIQENGNTYNKAKREIDRGRKTSHWIWYIFPQISGMGNSSTAKKYAVADFAEACEYLKNPTLFNRYYEILSSVHSQLKQKTDAKILMGSEIDALKLTSSLTLFEAAAEHLSQSEPQKAEYQKLAALCSDTLKILDEQNFKKCKFTLGKLSTDRPTAKPDSSPIPLQPEQKPTPLTTTQSQNSRKTLKVENKPLSSNVNANQQQKDKLLEQVNDILIRYLHMRHNEPSHWYQGLFKGYSKKDKLQAAFSLYMTINGIENSEKQWGALIKLYGLKSEGFTQSNQSKILPILRQGRLGQHLRTIAKSDEYPIPKTTVLNSPKNTVRSLVEYIDKEKYQPMPLQQNFS